MTPQAIFDPEQLSHTGPARHVDDIVAKLFQRAWNGDHDAQPLGWMQMTSNPTEAADLLNRPADFPKFYSFLTELGQSRFDTDGPDWEARRNLTQPLYRDAARTANRAMLIDAYDRWLTDDAVQSGDIGRALLAAASEIFLHAMGGTINTGPVADWLISLRETAMLVQHIAMFQPDTAQITQTKAAVATLRTELRALLSEDHALHANLGPRLSHLNDDFDLLGEITLNLFAGTETTVSSICWALNILARHPETQDRIAQDLLENGADAPALGHFIQETMRFCPPVPLLVRTVVHDNETLAGRPVTQGTKIALSIAGLHHHADHWSQPAQFDATRPEFVQNTFHRRAYLPFSAGPRVCGGLGLARAEIAIALHHILTRYRIAAVTTPIRYEYALTLRPLGTSQLTLTRRDGTSQ